MEVVIIARLLGCIHVYWLYQLHTTASTVRLQNRLEPIMLLNLPIMLFGNASIFPLLCFKFPYYASNFSYYAR